LASPDLKGDSSHLHFRIQLELQTERVDFHIHLICARDTEQAMH